MKTLKIIFVNLGVDTGVFLVSIGILIAWLISGVNLTYCIAVPMLYVLYSIANKISIIKARSRPIFIEYKTTKIQIAKSEHIYSKNEINLISEDQIRFGLNLPLIDKLQAVGAIKYDRTVCNDGIQITATIKYIIEPDK